MEAERETKRSDARSLFCPQAVTLGKTDPPGREGQGLGGSPAGRAVGSSGEREGTEGRSGGTPLAPGDPSAPKNTAVSPVSCTDLTVWIWIGSRGWRCAYLYRSGCVGSFSPHPLYCQEKGNMEKGKGNCHCSLCISKTKVLQIPFKSFSPGKKSCEVGEQEF